LQSSVIFRGVTELPTSYTYMTKLNPMFINYFHHFNVINQVFEITSVSLGLQTYMRCLSLWLDL
jgi:hypothetical protein